MASDRGVVSPKLFLRSERPMALDDESRVVAALADLTQPLEEGQMIELAGIAFEVVHP